MKTSPCWYPFRFGDFFAFRDLQTFVLPSDIVNKLLHCVFFGLVSQKQMSKKRKIKHKRLSISMFEKLHKKNWPLTLAGENFKQKNCNILILETLVAFA